jgi:hypothetical protein
MKSNQVVITIIGQANAYFVGAVLGVNRTTDEPGFLAHWFPAKNGTPTATSKGTSLADILFETENIVLVEGDKILKAKIKAEYARNKKEKAANEKAINRRK